MMETNKTGSIWPFWIQFVSIAYLIIIFAIAAIPMVLDVEESVQILCSEIGIGGSEFVCVFMIATGIIGIWQVRKQKLRPAYQTATFVLAILNLVIGGLVAAFMVFALILVLIFGVTV